MWNLFKRKPAPKPEDLFANRPKTFHHRPDAMFIDFAADTRHDISGLPIQLYAAWGRDLDRWQAAIHFAGEEITIDTLEANFNKFIAALREVEKGGEAASAASYDKNNRKHYNEIAVIDGTA